MKSTTIVFDIGGVLVPEGDRRVKLRTGLHDLVGDFNEADFNAAYWENRDAYDRGADAESYWSAVLQAAGVPSNQLSPEVYTEAALLDGTLNSVISESMFDLLCELKRHDHRLFILSNAPQSMAQAVRNQGWFTLFDDAIFSADNGAIKPEPASYEHIEMLGIDNPIYFDDRQINVDAALSRGWNAHLFLDETGARKFLEELGVLVSRENP